MMDLFEYLKEFNEEPENDIKFNSLILHFEELLNNDSEESSKEIDKFLQDERFIKNLLDVRILSKSDKRKKALNLMRKLREYCSKNYNKAFKYVDLQENVDIAMNKTFDIKWKSNVFGDREPSDEEIAEFRLDYFSTIDFFRLDPKILFRDLKSIEDFEKTDLYQKIQEVILTKNFDELTNRERDNIDKIFWESKYRFFEEEGSLLDNYSFDNEKDPSDVFVFLKTEDISGRIKNFYESKDDLSENDRKQIIDYFENYYEYALQFADKFPKVLDISLYCERINKFDIVRPTEDRKLLSEFIVDKYEDIGSNIVKNIDVNRMKSGDINVIETALKITEILSTGCTFYSELVDAFEAIKESGIDYLQTDAYRNLQESAFNMEFNSLAENRGKKVEEEPQNENQQSENEIDEDVLKINDFLNNSIRSLIESKESLFSKKGGCLNNFISVALTAEDPDFVELYELLKEKYKFEKIDIKAEEKIVDDFIKNNDIAQNEAEFDEFLVHLQNIKLKRSDYTLPMKYVKYIIKQTLEKVPCSVISEKKDKYRGLVEIAIQDLARNDLPMKIQKNKPYFYLVTDYLARDITLGTHSRAGYIAIKRSGIDSLIKYKDLDVLNTCFHENVHASQYYDFEHSDSEDISYNRYVMEKEDIIMGEKAVFYSDNYEKTFIEIEANEKAAQKLGLFLDSLKLSDKTKLNFMRDFVSEIVDECEVKAKEKKAEYKTGEIVTDENKDKNVYELFDEVIAGKPKYLEKYPNLKLEYNIDGKPKSIRELLEYGINAETSREKYLVAKVINKSNRMKIENFNDDMQAIIESFSSNFSENASLNALTGNTFLKKIVVENVGRVGMSILDNMDSMQEDDVLKIQNTVALIKNTISDSNNKRFADAMNTLDSRNPEITKTPLQIIDEIAEKISQRKIGSQNNSIHSKDIQILRNAYEEVSEDEIQLLASEIVQAKSVNALYNESNTNDKKSIQEDISK